MQLTAYNFFFPESGVGGDTGQEFKSESTPLEQGGFAFHIDTGRAAMRFRGNHKMIRREKRPSSAV